MYDNILVPVVFDEKHDTQAAFLVAKALAKKGAKFTLLHVLEPMPSYVANTLPAEVLAQSHQGVQKALKAAAAALPGAETAMIEGHPGRAIVDYANAHDIDCIIMASHRPGVADILLGSTADRVVRHAKCSVHVIR